MPARIDELFDPEKLRERWERAEPEPDGTAEAAPEAAAPLRPSATLDALASFREAAQADLGPRWAGVAALVARAEELVRRRDAAADAKARDAAQAELLATLDDLDDLMDAFALPPAG